MSKKYHFHFETFHLPSPYDDEWFQNFEMELTDEQFDRLCKAHRKWIDNENFIGRDCLQDDEYFIHRDLQDIWELLRTRINELAINIWGEGIREHLDQIDMYIPEEAWEVNCPED